MEKFQSLLKSRRFLLLLGGMVAVFSKELLNVELNEEHLTGMLTIVSAWILGDSFRETK